MIFKRKKVEDSIKEPSEQETLQSAHAHHCQEGSGADCCAEAALDSLQDTGGSLNQARDLANSDAAQDSGANNDTSSSKIAQLEVELSQQRESYLRALADFENYKKRAIKERSELIRYQGERVFVDLLDVVDNIERALASAGGEGTAFRTGVELIAKMFTELLTKHEVRPVSAIGKDFDPQKHEAINQIEVDDAKPGTVLSELRKAYFYRDRLLRTGQVVLAAQKKHDQQGNLAGKEASSDANETGSELKDELKNAVKLDS
jgi:molecular chaperone GrpE